MDYEEAFSKLDLKKTYLDLKKIMSWEAKDMTEFLFPLFFLWPVIEHELKGKKTEEELDNITLENMKDFPLWEKTKLIVAALKGLIKTSWIPLLPEYIRWNEYDEEPHQDRLNANMNCVSAIMSIPMSHKRTTLFTEPSMEFMMRLPTEYFEIFMVHFDIDSPEKMNQVMADFAAYAEISKRNWAFLEWWSSPLNYFVEFIHDSFGAPDSFCSFLEHFKINTVDQLTKLYPFGIVNGPLYKWHTEIWEKTRQDVYDLFGIDTLEKLTTALDKKLLNIELFKSEWCDYLRNLFAALWYTDKGQNLAFIEKEKFSDTIDLWKKYGALFDTKTLQYDATLDKEEYVKETLSILDKPHYIAIHHLDLESIKEVTEDNWYWMVLAYANLRDGGYYNFDADMTSTIESTFGSIKAKDLVYDKIHTILTNILEQNHQNISYRDIAIIKSLSQSHVGTLSSTTILVDITNSIWEFDNNADINPEIKEKDITTISLLENTIKNWPLADKTELYGHIDALFKNAPNLIDVFLEILWSLSPKTLKHFTKESAPLLISWALLMKPKKQERDRFHMYDDADTKKTDEENAAELEVFMTNIAHTILQESENPEKIKTDILLAMQSQIQQRFWLKTLPLEKISEEMETIQNYLTFLSNIYIPTEINIKLLGLLFGLQINDLWQDFRANKGIAYEDIFEESSLMVLRGYLENKKEYDLLKTYDHDTQFKIQQETITQRIWEVSTIDEELLSLEKSIEELLDPDNFVEDKEIFDIIMKYGKSIGPTLSNIFQWVKIEKYQAPILRDLEAIFWVIDEKKVPIIQWKLKHMNSLISFVSNIQGLQIVDKVTSLTQKKVPTEKLIYIFNKLGETFSTHSWIIPINNDVNYLKDRIHLDNDVLTTDEKQFALHHLESIESSINELHKDKETLVNLFYAFNKSISKWTNYSVSERMNSISNLIQEYGKQDIKEQSLTTKLTSDLNIVIPNIRWCLWCTQKEINNYHNLTFGDSNKFFAAIYSSNKNKTIADAIVDILPYETADGSLKKTFVVEMVYGERSPSVLLGIIDTIKQKQFETNITDIDILVSELALSSCNANLEHIQKAFEGDGLQIEPITTKVHIPESPSWYWHYEFGPGMRGIINTQWILISK